MSDISFEIEKEIAPLEDYGRSGFRMELNLVSWNGRDAKYDIRPWNEDHTEMRKGVTLTEEQYGNLVQYILHSEK